MKKDSVLRLAIVGVMFTLLNAVLVQQYRLNDVSNQLEISTMRADINTEFTNELIWLRVNGLEENSEQQLVAQGRLEGLIGYFAQDSEEQSHIENLWHEGYMRGLEQVDWEYDSVKESNYNQGFGDAINKLFPEGDHPAFINIAPRAIEEKAIQTPKFDVINDKKLKGNEEVIDSLNVKIKEVINK
tara:strand:+ start:1164 stop:1721 length:558 start_codon:yes stop_codon:yes gene_type:complete